MIRRPLVLLLVAGSVGVAAAGCGSSSTTTTTTTSSAPASAPTTTAAPATTTNTAAAATANPAVAQIVGACKSRIDSAGNLSASVKSKLTTLCDKAASGDQGGARKAASQVCQEIIKATVPQSVQNQALAGCPKA